MQGKNVNSSDAIEEILVKLNEENTADKSDTEFEFVFGAEESASGLVFDDSPNKEEEDKREEPVSKINFEIVSEPEEKIKEFSVPEKFEVSDKYNTVPTTEESPRIITTYVPRFTEASENYRMVDDRRPRFVKTLSNESENFATQEIYDDIDPTAEFDEDEKTPAVSVNVGKSEEDELTSASKVFKFVENEIDAEEAEIVARPEPPEAPEVEEICEVVEEKQDEPHEYSIPDPVDEGNSVVNYVAANVLKSNNIPEDAQEGIGDSQQELGNFKNKDYTSYLQRDLFKDRFLDTIMSVRVRFFAAAALTLLLAVVECLYAFGFDIVRAINLTGIPGAMVLLDIQLVLGLYLLSLPETIKAFKCLIKRRAVPELFLTVSFAVIIAYTVIITIYSPQEYSLFGLLFAVFALAAIGSSYFKCSADFASFKRISKNGEKTVVDKKFTRTLERENAALDGAVEEHKSKTARFFRTLFISDFFKRSQRCSENSMNFLIILASSFGAAAVTAVIAFFIPGGLPAAAMAFAFVFILACPAASIMLHKLPFFYASLQAESDNCAFIGESSLYDYSEVDVITFEDTEVFGPDDVTLQRIMLYGRSDNLAKALRQMSALFMNVGGPLDVLFSDALDRKCSPALSVYVEKNGIGGEIDGHSVLAGTMEYMLEKGAVIPEEDAARQESPYDSTKIMYAAEDGVVYAKFYIRYSFSEEFSMLLPMLEDYGIKPLVYTRDPNITDELIITLTAGTDKIRVLKKHTISDVDSPLYRKISAGAVTDGDKVKAINLILLSKRYANLQSRLAITELISMIVGCVLAVVLSLGGMSLVPSVFLAAWQAAWCAALHLISRKNFSVAKDKSK